METICMKYQILFSGKNKKNITNLSSAELALRVVKVKIEALAQTTHEGSLIRHFVVCLEIQWLPKNLVAKEI